MAAKRTKGTETPAVIDDASEQIHECMVQYILSMACTRSSKAIASVPLIGQVMTATRPPDYYSADTEGWMTYEWHSKARKEHNAAWPEEKVRLVWRRGEWSMDGNRKRDKRGYGDDRDSFRVSDLPDTPLVAVAVVMIQDMDRVKTAKETT